MEFETTARLATHFLDDPVKLVKVVTMQYILTTNKGLATDFPEKCLMEFVETTASSYTDALDAFAYCVAFYMYELSKFEEQLDELQLSLEEHFQDYKNSEEFKDIKRNILND